MLQISLSGTEQGLYSFGGGSDEGTPGAGIIESADGTPYGLTADGGSKSGGTVFTINGGQEEPGAYHAAASPGREKACEARGRFAVTRVAQHFYRGGRHLFGGDRATCRSRLGVVRGTPLHLVTSDWVAATLR